MELKPLAVHVTNSLTNPIYPTKKLTKVALESGSKNTRRLTVNKAATSCQPGWPRPAGCTQRGNCGVDNLTQCTKRLPYTLPTPQLPRLFPLPYPIGKKFARGVIKQKFQLEIVQAVKILNFKACHTVAQGEGGRGRESSFSVCLESAA